MSQNRTGCHVGRSPKNGRPKLYAERMAEEREKRLQPKPGTYFSSQGVSLPKLKCLEDRRD